MEKNSGLHLLNKKLGETPNECIERFKKENPEYFGVSMTYAGRLDPMAEGLLLVLSGKEIKNKEKYNGLEKTYIFSILWGFKTDTQDILGKVTKSGSVKVPSELEIQEMLGKSVGKFTQDYPAYSSKPVSGIPLFQWAREGKIDTIKIPKHEVEIFDAKFLSRQAISKEGMQKDILMKISLVVGDFRQSEISEKWLETLASCEEREFVIDQVELSVSSGFYVRQFVSDFSEKFDSLATTFHIKREKVGDFSVEVAEL